MAGSWIPFERVEQLVGEAPPRSGAYITVSAFGAAGEKKVGRLELDGVVDPVSQVRGLLDAHGREPGVEKCRVRLWRKGGVPGPSVTCRWDATGTATPAVEPTPPSPGKAKPRPSRSKASSRAPRPSTEPGAPSPTRRLECRRCKDLGARLVRIEQENRSLSAQHRRALAVVTNEKRARVELQGQLEHGRRAMAALQRKLEREARAKADARRQLEHERQRAEADNKALSSQLSAARSKARRWQESEDELEDLREANAVLTGMVDGLIDYDD